MRAKRVVIATIVSSACAAMVACSDSEAGRRAAQNRRPRSEQISLSDSIETFNHLYDRVNLEVEPPDVILDRRKTLDGEKAYATFGLNPAIEDAELSSYFTITSRNAPLKALDVKPGDQVQYFIREKEDDFTKIGEEGNQTWTGDAEFEPINMTVSQVVDDEHLIIEGVSPLVVDGELGYEIQILRYVDDRAQDIRERLNAYAGYAQPLLGWEPSPDSGEIENALNLLNQWMRHTYADSADAPFEPAAILETLPESIRKSARLAKYVSPEALGHVAFAPHEGRLLQQAIWMRNISNWARADAVGDVDLARRLFDWTVRHIQLEVADADQVLHHLARDPWEVLLFGKGTAQQRAWVFVHLCRQQGLPAVVLAAPQGAQGEAEGQSAPQFWCVAVASQDRLYLFDPALGLPIPSLDGQGIATLADAASDPQVLRQLDLDDAHRYPWSSHAAQHVQAMIAASPLSLSRRAALLQEKLVGQSGFVIADNPAELAATLTKHEQIKDARLWAWPFEVLDRKLAMGLDQNQPQRVRAALEFRVFAFEPHLWKARSLHFRGPAMRSGDGQGDDEADALDGHQEAIRLYQASLAATWEFAREQSDEKRQTMQAARKNATYWLGLLKMDQGLIKPDDRDLEIAATSWFPQVIDAKPPSDWLGGARYNLAQVHQSMGRSSDAVALFEKDDSLQHHGNRLRARWLRDANSQAEPQPGP